MQPAVQTESLATSPTAQPAGGVLRCDRQPSVASGSRTHAHIADEVAKQGAQRVGILAIITSVTVVGVAILQQALQPEMSAAHDTPLFRLSALFLVLAGIGLAALQHADLVTPQELLDLGLVFEVAGTCALTLMENAAPWLNSPLRGATDAVTWIALCVVVIPNRPWKSIVAAVASAASVPMAHLAAAQMLGYAPL